MESGTCHILLTEKVQAFGSIVYATPALVIGALPSGVERIKKITTALSTVLLLPKSQLQILRGHEYNGSNP